MTNTSEDAYRHIVAQSVAFLYPAALRAAALLEVAEQLADGPRDVAELAGLTGANGPYLRRLLRFLASHGTFREDEDGRFHLTPQADLLRADAVRSMRAGVLMATQDGWWQSAADLTEAVRHGEPAFDRRFGQPVFAYLAEHPENGPLFDAGMAAFSAGDIGYIIDGYDFPDDGVMVDVGGGRGGLLLAVLRARPGLRGILLDQEKALAGNVLPELGADDRWTLHPGDFFSSVPAGDLYTVKNVLHDWNDDQCAGILENCRRAMNPGAPARRRHGHPTRQRPVLRQGSRHADAAASPGTGTHPTGVRAPLRTGRVPDHASDSHPRHAVHDRGGARLTGIVRVRSGEPIRVSVASENGISRGWADEYCVRIPITLTGLNTNTPGATLGDTTTSCT